MYKIKKEDNFKYYKYVNWTQPTLTGGGAMGYSNFATYGLNSYSSTRQATYDAFYPNTGTIYTYLSLKVSTFYCYFQSKNPLLISKFQFYIPINGTQNDGSGGYAKNLTLYGYNEENNTWEQIGYIAGGTSMGKKTHTMDLSKNTKAYRLYRFQGTTKGAGHNDELEVSSVKITAKELVESNKHDYDIMKKISTYKTYHEDNKYKAYKVK